MTVTSANHKIRKLKSYAMNALCIACALLVILPLVVVLFYLISKGASSVNLAFFTQLPHGPNTPGAGMANAIVGTVELLLLASFVGIPAGVLGGVYLSEYGGERLNRWIRFWADVLNGVPSIVWGMLAYALIVAPMKGFSAWAGGLALGFIMLPLVLRTTEEVLVLVPRSYREAALALGLPQWKTIMMIVLPTAMRGIVTGILLAMGRIAGETAPLLFTALGNDYWNKNLGQPIAALPLQIFKYAISGFDEWHRQAWAGALVLVAMTFCLSLGVRIFSAGRFQKNT
jgi:phosphate transport system permease protein